MAVTSQRQVLLMLRDSQRGVHESVTAYARQAGWQLEFSRSMRPGWHGDGLIADLLTEEELASFRTPSRLAVVTRSRELSGPLIRHVHGDVDAIARLALAHFRERGYEHFATADARAWVEDPCAAFVSTVRAAGFPAEQLFWGDDYGDALDRLRVFLAAQPKPCAVLVPALLAIGLFYRACALEGIHIPQQIALLVNNDDTLICESFTPTVSSIDGQITRFGWAMAKRLDDLMHGRDEDPAPLVIGPDRVIFRQSTDMLAVPHGPTARAVQHLLAHYNEPLTVADLAGVAGMSVANLEQRFRRHLGKLPRQLLCERRIERAKELLCTTEQSLSQIAVATGYGSAMALHTAFTRTIGCNPGAFRAGFGPSRLEHPPEGPERPR